MEDRPQGVTVAAIAHDFGTSVPSLYRWRRRLYAALSDAPPGPSPRALPGSLSHHQRALLEAASASAATLSLRERRAWILQLHGEGVSVRGIRDLLLRRFGPAESLSVGTIEAFLKQAGRTACSLLVTLVRPVLDRVLTAAGDDIYLHGQAVKVLMEPVSGVILQTLRWNERDAEVWDLLLSQFPALKLFVGDGAREFDAAAEMRNLLRGLDLMHERPWWTRKVFRRLSSWQRRWHQNTQRKLLEQVQAQVETLGETQAAIESLLRHPRRSSSLVESFNARVRVLQMSRRNVSDRLLGLAALRWNVEKREEGPRRGTSPYGLLGVLEEADERRWWEVLLDALEEEEREATAQAA
jgi:transposase-like protein